MIQNTHLSTWIQTWTWSTVNPAPTHYYRLRHLTATATEATAVAAETFLARLPSPTLVAAPPPSLLAIKRLARLSAGGLAGKKEDETEMAAVATGRSKNITAAAVADEETERASRNLAGKSRARKCMRLHRSGSAVAALAAVPGTIVTPIAVTSNVLRESTTTRSRRRGGVVGHPHRRGERTRLPVGARASCRISVAVGQKGGSTNRPPPPASSPPREGATSGSRIAVAGTTTIATVTRVQATSNIITA